MQLDEKHMKTVIMFNKTYQRACWHKKKKVRKLERKIMHEHNIC